MNSSNAFNDVLTKGDMIEFIRNNLYLDIEKIEFDKDILDDKVLRISLNMLDEGNVTEISHIDITQSDLEHPTISIYNY